MPNPQNPVINGAGSTTLSPTNFCTWQTAAGAGVNSTINITNQSLANNCVVAITGAPTAGVVAILNGVSQASLDSIFTIPPNQPNFQLTGFGTFGGSQVTITNITNPTAPATAFIVTQTTPSS
jgi:hypothetical protein